MSLLSKLFGGGAKSAPEPVRHKEFSIFATPQKEAGGFRICARIEKDVNGTVKTHNMIRADTVGSLEEAIAITERKAASLIDQLGESIFD